MATTQNFPPLAFNASLRWDVVSRLLPQQPGSVLEIGCGRGAMSSRIAQRAESLVAIEPDATSFEVAKNNLGDSATVLNILSDALPENEKFDTICAFEVLEHIEDDWAALAEWRGLLRPGGTLLLSVPAWQDRMDAADEMAGHFRRYSPSQISEKLAGSGFTTIHTQLYGFPAGYLLEAGRNALAKKSLAKGSIGEDFAERTAGSGRFFQPDRGIWGSAVEILSIPMKWGQRLFPNRGPGLVVKANYSE